MRFINSHGRRYLTFLFRDSSMIAALLSRDGKSFIHLSEVALSPSTIVNDEVVNTDALAAQIGEVRKQFHTKDTEVVIGVSEVKATTHSLELPPLSSEEITQAIEQESSSFLPFPYNEEYLDWMRIKKNEDGSEKILLSAIPKALIDGYVHAFHKAGLRPVAFETTSLSLFRLLPEEAKESCLAMEVGGMTTLLVLGYQGTIEASSVIQESAGIEEKVEKLIYYYAQKRTEGKLPEKIYICGKNVTTELVSQLKARLKLKPVYLTSSVAGLNSQQKLSYAVLTSLASKKVAPPEDASTINILPERLQTQYEQEQQATRIAQFAYAHVVVMALLCILAGALYMYTANLRRGVEEQAVSVQGSQMLTFAPERARLMTTAAQRNKRMEEALVYLLGQSPDGVALTGAQYESKTQELVLLGTAHSRNHLLAFKDAVQATGQFKKVTIPLSSLEKELDVTFRLIVSVE